MESEYPVPRQPRRVSGQCLPAKVVHWKPFLTATYGVAHYVMPSRLSTVRRRSRDRTQSVGKATNSRHFSRCDLCCSSQFRIAVADAA